MPPVGQKSTSGKTLRRARTYAGPPTDEAGKTFTTAAPAEIAARTSVGVSGPRISNAFRLRHGSASDGSVHGATMKAAPAARHASAQDASGTVPAPTVNAVSRASSRISALASGTVIVISKIDRPASRS